MKPFSLAVAAIFATVLSLIAYFSKPTLKFFRSVRFKNDWELNIVGHVWNFRIARRQIALWRNYQPVFQFFPNWKTGMKLATVALCVVLAACDGIVVGFKAGLAASKPFVQSLVDSGTVTQTVATAVTKDLDDGVNVLGVGQDCLKSAKLYTGGAKRIEKAKCYYQAAQGLRVILARRNFEANEKLTRYSTIVSGAIEAFEAYYTAVNSRTESTGPDGGITHTGADGISGENADKSLEESLKARKKELDELIKGN